jgi:hypothetical protein
MDVAAQMLAARGVQTSNVSIPAPRILIRTSDWLYAASREAEQLAGREFNTHLLDSSSWPVNSVKSA